jgi:hypothetical protein
VIEMYIVLAIVLLLAPLGALYVLERMARAGKGPLADPDRVVVLDGTIIPVPAPVGAPDDAWKREPLGLIDDEACAAESCLVTSLIAGELDRAQYQERMADLAAADAAIRPVRLPPDAR